MSEEKKWLYIDDGGVERGPFSDRVIRGWWKKKYFKPSHLFKSISAEDQKNNFFKDFTPIGKFFDQLNELQSTPQQNINNNPTITNTHQNTNNLNGSASASSNEKVLVESENQTKLENTEKPHSQNDDQMNEDESNSNNSNKDNDNNKSVDNDVEDTLDFSWKYIDLNGVEQGPFESSQIITWFNAGFIPVDTKFQRIKKSSLQPIDDFTAIKDMPLQTFLDRINEAINNKAKEKSNPDLDIPSDLEDEEEKIKQKEKEKDKDKDKDKILEEGEEPEESEESGGVWFYQDPNGKEHGPWSSKQMGYWYSKGIFLLCGEKVLIRNGLDSGDFSFKKISEYLPTPSFIKNLIHSNPANHEERWYYIDNDNVEQGPFLTQQMAQWYERGQFESNPSLLLRKLGQHRHEYSRLNDNDKQFSFKLRPSNPSNASNSVNPSMVPLVPPQNFSFPPPPVNPHYPSNYPPHHYQPYNNNYNYNHNNIGAFDIRTGKFRTSQYNLNQNPNAVPLGNFPHANPHVIPIATGAGPSYNDPLLQDPAYAALIAQDRISHDQDRRSANQQAHYFDVHQWHEQRNMSQYRNQIHKKPRT